MDTEIKKIDDDDEKFIIRPNSNRRKDFGSLYQMEAEFSRFFFISGILKLLITILSVVILIIIARFGVDYSLIIIISTCICSFFYIAISLFADLAIVCLILHAMSQCQVAQFLTCVLLLCGWLISMGISISHSLRAGADSTEPFAWIGQQDWQVDAQTCSGFNVGLFIALSAMYCTKIVSFIFQQNGNRSTT